jgi:ubiquinone/menaquinone biosynthesis C-methylase UbiE
MDFVPEPGAAYFYDGYTRPDARRRGIDAAVRAAIFEALRALGRSRVYSYVRDDNPVGNRAAGRCQQVVATVRYVRFVAGRPLVFDVDTKRLAALVRRPGPKGVDDAVNRAADWRAWFEGWLKEPLAKRSIGFHELPEAAFRAMARHISSTLNLDPSRDLVLDLGCDSALVTRLVAPRCARLVGVDFIPGMLVDAQRGKGGNEAVPKGLCFAAADGRALPFPSETFAKAYCSGVVHTLPSREDGFAMILELVRVSKPGGQVLIAAVPDVRKRWRARREAWRSGGVRERAHLVAAAALPRSAKRLARRLVPWLPRAPLQYLEYDLREVQTLLEDRGLDCTIVDYPRDFWSRDFRETRSNLLIAVPPRAARPTATLHPQPPSRDRSSAA